MECCLHILTVFSEKASKLLRFLLFFLQRHHNSLPFLCLWLREQKKTASSEQKENTNHLNPCHKLYSKILSKKGLNTPRKNNTPVLQCTHHMCPVRLHWHVKEQMSVSALYQINQIFHTLICLKWKFSVNHKRLKI